MGAVAQRGGAACKHASPIRFKNLPPRSSCPVRSWLIAIAYWLAGGFIKSGLGNRIAYAIVSAFGKTSLGLTYSLVFAEALLSPAIPSVAARAGGIFFPLAKVRAARDGASGPRRPRLQSRASTPATPTALAHARAGPVPGLRL